MTTPAHALTMQAAATPCASPAQVYPFFSLSYRYDNTRYNYKHVKERAGGSENERKRYEKSERTRDKETRNSIGKRRATKGNHRWGAAEVASTGGQRGRRARKDYLKPRSERERAQHKIKSERERAGDKARSERERAEGRAKSERERAKDKQMSERERAKGRAKERAGASEG